MMTSRAEFRLVLRQDNADSRLTEIGRKIGLVNDERYQLFKKKQEILEKMRKKLEILIKIDEKTKKFLKENQEPIPSGSIKAIDLLKRNNIDIYKLNETYDLFSEEETRFMDIINTEVKYSGYIKQQNDEIEKLKKQEEVSLVEVEDYSKIKGLRIEAQQKLNKIRPETLGQASRISGVSPADITVLSIYLKTRKK